MLQWGAIWPGFALCCPKDFLLTCIISSLEPIINLMEGRGRRDHRNEQLVQAGNAQVCSTGGQSPQGSWGSGLAWVQPLLQTSTHLAGQVGMQGPGCAGSPCTFGQCYPLGPERWEAYGPGWKPAFRSPEGLGCDFRFARPGQPQFCLLLAVKHQR